MFRFIRIDFMVINFQYSFMPNISEKTILTDTKTILFLTFSVYLTSQAFRRALNLSLNSRCVYLLFVNIP